MVIPTAQPAPGRAYAGIESRNTPDHIVVLIKSIGRAFAKAGWTLRTAGAASAESAFERGCAAVDGRTEVVALPACPAEVASTNAESWWPETLLPWGLLSAKTRALLAQGTRQILGRIYAVPLRPKALFRPSSNARRASRRMPNRSPRE